MFLSYLIRQSLNTCICFNFFYSKKRYLIHRIYASKLILSQNFGIAYMKLIGTSQSTILPSHLGRHSTSSLPICSKDFCICYLPFQLMKHIDPTLPHFISTLKIVTFNPRVKIRTRKGHQKVNKYKKDISMSHKLAI